MSASAPPGHDPSPPPPAYSEVCPLPPEAPRQCPALAVPLSLGLLAALVLVLVAVVAVLAVQLDGVRAGLELLEPGTVGQVRGQVQRLETGIHNSSLYYRGLMAKLNRLYTRVEVLEVQLDSRPSQHLQLQAAGGGAGPPVLHLMVLGLAALVL